MSLSSCCNDPGDQNKIDMMRMIRFTWRHWRIYFGWIAAMVLLAVVYKKLYSSLYESMAVLYYPAAQSDEIKNVADRELMDDAIAVMQQEKMLNYAEERAGISWKEIQSGLTISGNGDSGIITVACQMSGGELACDCVNAVVMVFCERLPEVVPIGELVVLTEPEISRYPLYKGWAGTVLFSLCAAIAGATGSVCMAERKKMQEWISSIVMNESADLCGR